MTQYIATLRAIFEAESDADAIMIAWQIRNNGEEELELDEGDSIDVSQVTCNPLEIQPAEVLTVLYRARNQLIKTKVKWAVELAMEVDKGAWTLKHRAEKETSHQPGYPAHRFMEIFEAILTKGENPLE